MHSKNFATLSPHAVKLLIDLLSQFNGKNNGDLAMPWTLMKDRGWKSRGTLNRARKELMARGWIMVTRQGGKHLTTLYAITWLPIDDCGGKLDVSETYTAPDDWKKIDIASTHMGHIDTAVVSIEKGGRRKIA